VFVWFHWEPPPSPLGLFWPRSLQDLGFSTNMIDRFFRPFLGGIFFDNDLRVSSRLMEFVFRVLAVGENCLPARGVPLCPVRCLLAEHFRPVPIVVFFLCSPSPALLSSFRYRTNPGAAGGWPAGQQRAAEASGAGGGGPHAEGRGPG
jgi:hypothetical protein